MKHCCRGNEPVRSPHASDSPCIGEKQELFSSCCASGFFQCVRKNEIVETDMHRG
jgi:hypothetical protein